MYFNSFSIVNLKPNKRLLVSVRVAIFLLMCSLIVGCNNMQSDQKSKEITVVSYGGGAYQESHKKAFCEPFSIFAGINVESTTWDADYGKLKGAVQSNSSKWDVVEVTAAQFARGQREGLFEKLKIKPSYGKFMPDTISDYGVANVYWSTVLAYKKSSFPSSPPKNWADFFDPINFPGKRALYDDPRGNLEFALLADGVPVNQLYPLDVDRAFKKLDQIKPYIRVWWTDGTQPVQLLLSGAVDISSAWNGRIYASPQARKEIGYIWQGAAQELDYWVIPRGSKNIDEASRFIAYASSPWALAQQTELIGYGPVNISSLDYVSEEARIHLPTYEPNWKNSFVVNADWWAKNEVDIKSKWVEWKNK